MNKPQLCLALSVSLALLQANLLPAFAGTEDTVKAPAGIAQGTPKKVAANKTAVTKKRVATAVTKKTANSANQRLASLGTVSVHSTAFGDTTVQSMLFLRHKDDSGAELPAAALTIHPAMSLDAVEAAANPATKDQPTLVAMNDQAQVTDATKASADQIASGEKASDPQPQTTPNGEIAATPQAEATGDDHSKQLLAQLSPDQIVAQGDQAGTTATPIPPVVSGAVELEEFKPSNVIELKVGQSRTFRLKNKVNRTSISDPSTAEPVVMSEREIMLLGKASGTATLVVWDDAGNSAAIDVKVTKDYSALQSMLREIDPRIIVKPFSVAGSDRVLLLGDVDHAEPVLRAFSAANAFMDDRGMNIIAANSRLVNGKPGEGGGGAGGGGGGGGGTGQLAQLSQVDRYTFFNNMSNNVAKAQVMVSDGGRVTSLIKVRKTPLIVLHCTFMEMNTAAVRELGVQLGLNFTNNSFSFGLGGNNNTGQSSYLSTAPGINGVQGTTQFEGPGKGPFTPGQVTSIIGQAPTSAGLMNTLGFLTTGVGKLNDYGGTTGPVTFSAANTINQLVGGSIQNNPVSNIGLGVLNSAPAGLLGQTVLLGAPGGANFVAGGLSNLFTSVSNFVGGNVGRFSLNPTVQGIITHNRARVLAEPTLVTISGERAAFLAGGEIPIVQSIATAGTSQQSVSFEPFGLRLNMIPTLLENGAINLEVSPEERLLSQTLALNVLGGTTSPIPGFTTRKTQTIVEMRPGQELYISGLVSANSGREVDKTPILGEVPVLGALYRSKSFSKNESELVVSVRPEIIIPGTPGQLKLPEEISKVEGVRDTNLFQVEPTVLDERYMTSGRADRTQKIPGIQPAGAPIPDSE